MNRMEYFQAILLVLFVPNCWSLIKHNAKYNGKTEVWEGEPFKISCVISVYDAPGWTINSSVVITDDNYLGYNLSERTIDHLYQEFILEVKFAQLHHKGEYRCNKYSRDFHKINVIPSFVDEYEIDNFERENAGFEFKKYTLQVNETFEFYCSAVEEDTPITWYKNTDGITEHSESNIILSGLTLIIENAQEDDAGEYRCSDNIKVPDGFSGIGRVFILNSPAKVIDFPERENIILGRTLNLQCKAQGFPQPKLTWYIGNEEAAELQKTDERMSIYLSPGAQPVSYLMIRNVDPSDRGLYTCRANNSMDSGKTFAYDEESVFVYVMENMIETNEEEPGRGKILIPDEPLVLQCNTSECPHCTVVWFKDGEPLHPIPNHLEMYENNNSFVIKSANYNDSGIYMCAIDRRQLDVALNATIVVQSKIKLEKFETSSVVVEGSPLELHCSVKGSPAPYIKWFIGEKEIYEDDERIKLLEHDGLKKGKLLIEKADYQDRNHYTCEAFNQVDSVNTTVFIRIKDKLAALWPFLGICAEVAILCSIIFVYERRKSKSEREEAETDLPSENKHHHEQRGKGHDVRQRK